MPQPSRHVTARLSIRRGTKAHWKELNTVLLEGEPGWEVDTKRLKIGDGVTNWNDLQYYKIGDSEAAESFVHDNSVVPEYITTVSSALEYFGAKFKAYDDQGVLEFTAGLQGLQPSYVLTIAAGSGGSALDLGSQVVAGDTYKPITALPFTGYAFDYWQGENIANINASETTILIEGDQYVRANFKLITP
jgi:hypothetical protein